VAVVFRRRDGMVKGNGLSKGAFANQQDVYKGHRSPKALYLALWTGFEALLAYRGHYRALAGGATIPGGRPVRPDFEKPYLPSLAAARRFDALRPASPCRRGSMQPEIIVETAS
jgi:hypothetical protein